MKQDSNKKPIRINENQILILKLVYTFRFVSISLIARLRKVSNTAVDNTINTLVEKGLLNKRYEKAEYIRLGLPAAYSLTPAGARLLKEHLEVNDKYVHTQYGNTRVEDKFIGQCLDILKGYILFSELYPDTFTIFTRPEIIDFEDSFPLPLPNLYLNRNKPSGKLPDYYLLDMFTNTPDSVIARRINVYIRHYKSGRWEEDEYPVFLMVLDSSKKEDFVQYVLGRALKKAKLDEDEITVMTTTKRAFFDGRETAIWSAEDIPLSSL